MPSATLGCRAGSIAIRAAKASNRDARTLADLFVRSFSRDPSICWTYNLPSVKHVKLEESPIHRELVRMRAADYNRALSDPTWHAFIARDVDTDQDVGFSAWISPDLPGCRRSITRYEQLRGLAFEIFDLSMSSRLWEQLQCRIWYRHLGMQAFDRRRSGSAEAATWYTRYMRSEDNQRGYYNLSLLGVLPEYRGKGIAYQLAGWGLEQADEHDLSVYVFDASPGGVKVYERLGLTKLGEDVLHRDEANVAIPEVTMRRLPRSSRQT